MTRKKRSCAVRYKTVAGSVMDCPEQSHATKRSFVPQDDTQLVALCYFIFKYNISLNERMLQRSKRSVALTHPKNNCAVRYKTVAGSVMNRQGI
ncbi:hypothetical protein [Solitalea canadensis]|uniref:hypothetical protein n=1 Tax=Solitalea canadensis TaxID=995 RepID=UPI0012FB7AC6|nr:hypothetical protein [Solitalea canadensis]